MPRKVNTENLTIQALLPYEFNNCELSLEGWGEVDCYANHEGVQIFLEVERTQKHPNTNVLKVWPYLDTNSDAKVLLIQLFRPENKAPRNRRKLCEFTAMKLEHIYPGRFRYVKCDDVTEEIRVSVEEKLKELQ